MGKSSIYRAVVYGYSKDNRLVGNHFLDLGSWSSYKGDSAVGPVNTL